MKKNLNLIAVITMLFVFYSQVLKAGMLDELGYLHEKTDFYAYINFSDVMKFVSSRGLDINELDSFFNDGSDIDADKSINKFGLKLSDINELLVIANLEDIKKKSGYLIFISIKNGKGIIPEDFKKNSIKLKSGTAYKASLEDDVIFSKANDFFIIGPAAYVESFLEKKSLKKSSLSARSLIFRKKASARTIYHQITMTDYFKAEMNKALNTGPGRVLKDNVFINTLLTLESADGGLEIGGDKIIFTSGMQGAKAEDSERLLMISHTWIVGTSFLMSFADTYMMGLKTGAGSSEEFPEYRELMTWLQKAFGRIHVKQVDRGIVSTFEIAPAETDILISFIKKEMDKEKKARLERIEREKIAKLTRAVAENNFDIVKKYIREKYNLNGLDTDGKTPLGVSAANGSVKIARLLVENGAGVNIPDVDKLTPLHHAVKSEQKEIITFLLGKGADVNARGESDLTPLHYNALQGNSEISRILIAKGAIINSVDADSSTPLHYAASQGFISVVKILVEKKADPDMKNINDQRAIDIAAQNNQIEVVNFLKAAFKQEPKTSSFEDGDSSNDFNLDDGDIPADEDPGDGAIENEE